jgi:hypothetical protein
VSAVPEPYEPDRQHFYDVRPLLTVLQKITDAARRRKASGVDDEAVKYGRLAFLALDYVKADQRGDIDECRRLIDKIWEAQL